MDEAKVENIKAEIAAELYAAFKRLGARFDLLSIVGNYGAGTGDYWGWECSGGTTRNRDDSERQYRRERRTYPQARAEA